MDIRVRDKATGQIRTVTHKAYAALGPKVYEKLGPEDGSETQESPNSTGPQFSRSVKAAGPVVSEQIPAPEPEKTEPQPIFRMEDPQAEPKVKGKPGPKPKKSISSNSTTDEK